MPPLTFDASDIERFMRFVDKHGPDDCWPWLGSRRNGYGTFSLRNRDMVATHVALAIDGRPRPSSDHEACHSCDNPPCVNPAHLWWGTRIENLQDCAAKKRHGLSRRAACSRGHVFPEDAFVPGIGRRCAICARIRNRAYRARKRAERKAA